jgi:hypothetical protein
METEGWRFEGFDTPSVLLFGTCLPLFVLTISYVVMQHHFLRYLEKKSRTDYDQLGRPDPWLRMTQDGGYFPFDVFIISKRYSSLHDATALQMAKRMRELLFAMCALLAFTLGCTVYLHYA